MPSFLVSPADLTAAEKAVAEAMSLPGAFHGDTHPPEGLDPWRQPFT
ncbi:MAG: hypothetical protein QOJ50_3158 [Cryptosporangiaceae bacterium]|nr:hypothetical protein [Cryptosporangiaceae bacterium]